MLVHLTPPAPAVCPSPSKCKEFQDLGSNDIKTSECTDQCSDLCTKSTLATCVYNCEPSINAGNSWCQCCREFKPEDDDGDEGDEVSPEDDGNEGDEDEDLYGDKKSGCSYAFISLLLYHKRNIM